MKLLSPAKINLFLHVVRKRTDGYHDLFSLMCCIGLYDNILIDFDATKLSVSCNHPRVPADESNLVYKAAAAFFNATGKPQGIRIDIDKNIPVGAGLGGGSSNAATVLLGLNRHYGKPLPMKELMVMGRSLGADVPFFLFGKPALARGIGEKLEHYTRIPPYHVLLINPGYEVSTAEVYKNLNLGLTKCEKTLKEDTFKKECFDVKRHLCNDLEAVTTSMHPDIKTVKQLLLKQGAAGALMAGSGPTVFGLFVDPQRAKEVCKSITQYRREQMFLADLIIG